MDISFSAPRTLLPLSDLTPPSLICRHTRTHTQTYMQFGLMPFLSHTGLYNVLFLQTMPASRFHPKPYNFIFHPDIFVPSSNLSWKQWLRLLF